MKAELIFKLSDNVELVITSDEHDRFSDCCNDLDHAVAAVKGKTEAKRDIGVYVEFGKELRRKQ